MFDPFPEDRYRKQDQQETDDRPPAVRIKMHEYRHHECGRKEEPQQHQPDEQAVVETRIFPQRREQLAVQMSQRQRPQQRRHRQDRRRGREDIPPESRDPLLDPRHIVGHGHPHQPSQQDAVKRYAEQRALEQLPPCALVLGALRRRTVPGEKHLEPLGQMPLEPAVGRLALLNYERRCEGGNHRNGHRHRIEERTGHTERKPERRDNKGELSDLRERKRGLQRQAQILSRNQETDCPVKNLPCNHHEGKQQDRSHILPQQRRFDQHADRHEKNRPEEVFDRRHHFFDRFGFGGPGQYRAHYERAEGRRKADRIGQHDHTEAQAQRNDQQRLGIEQPPYAPQQRRDQVNRHNEPRNEEKEQFEQPSCNIRLFDVLLHVKGRKQHEQHHGEQVFDDQYAEHLPGKFAVTQAQVVERLDDDRGRGHGQHAAEENTVGRGPVQHASGHKAGAHHPGDDHHRRHQRGAAHLHQFIEAELEPERKEQEDDADLGPDIHVIHVRHPFEQEIPAAKESGDDVAQHDRLFQFFYSSVMIPATPRISARSEISGLRCAIFRIRIWKSGTSPCGTGFAQPRPSIPANGDGKPAAQKRARVPRNFTAKVAISAQSAPPRDE